MEDKELLTLAGRLNLPEAVLAPLAAAAPVLSVHIPSDAVLDREELAGSYDMALRFFSQEKLCPWGRPRAMVCSSWLLAPPENSGIRRFAGDYRLYDVDEEDQEFYEWMGTSPWKNCRSIPASSGQ